MSKPVIRPARVEDAGVLRQMEEECFSDPWSRENLLSELASDLSVIRIAEQNGEAQGYFIARIVLGEGELRDPKEPENAEEAPAAPKKTTRRTTKKAAEGEEKPKKTTRKKAAAAEAPAEDKPKKTTARKTAKKDEAAEGEAAPKKRVTRKKAETAEGEEAPKKPRTRKKKVEETESVEKA